MSRTKSNSGFTLIELLVVLAIIAIISGIAIPAYLGQRRRAKVIGDAKSHAHVLQTQVATALQDASKLTAGVTQDWTSSGSYPAVATSWAPFFTPQGNSKMDYHVTTDATGLGYSITVTDPEAGNALVLTLTSDGQMTVTPKYQ